MHDKHESSGSTAKQTTSVQSANLGLTNEHKLIQELYLGRNETTQTSSEDKDHEQAHSNGKYKMAAKEMMSFWM